MKSGDIDASSFTAIRLLSGAITLLVLLRMQGAVSISFDRYSWFSAICLFIYAAAFSFAYLLVDTGIGALALFGAVQITMIAYSVGCGQKLLSLQWTGVVTAFSGLVYLVWPDLATPSLSGFGLMALSGMAWGIYSLLGKCTNQPLRATTNNFILAIPMAVLLFCLGAQWDAVTASGVTLAVASGALTSGVGYAVWYKALAKLTASSAAVLQLTVPIIAAIGGVMFANEPITARLFWSSVAVLGGVLLVLVAARAKAS